MTLLEEALLLLEDDPLVLLLAVPLCSALLPLGILLLLTRQLSLPVSWVVAAQLMPALLPVEPGELLLLLLGLVEALPLLLYWKVLLPLLLYW